LKFHKHHKNGAAGTGTGIKRRVYISPPPPPEGPRLLRGAAARRIPLGTAAERLVRDALSAPPAFQAHLNEVDCDKETPSETTVVTAPARLVACKQRGIALIVAIAA